MPRCTCALAPSGNEIDLAQVMTCMSTCVSVRSLLQWTDSRVGLWTQTLRCWVLFLFVRTTVKSELTGEMMYGPNYPGSGNVQYVITFPRWGKVVMQKCPWSPSNDFGPATDFESLHPWRVYVNVVRCLFCTTANQPSPSSLCTHAVCIPVKRAQNCW